MKTTEAKISGASAIKKTPLFGKEGGQSFFRPGRHGSPFFSKAPTHPAAIQAKLSIGEPNDVYEKEADSMADKVVQRVQKKPIFESEGENPEGEVQRKCAACERDEQLQKKSDTGSQSTAPPSVESSLNASKGSGSPLPDQTREPMESSFGADFSKVRVHDNSSAVQMNKDLHAQAFTHGNDIYFDKGKYDVNSKGGQHLLAHELTHVVQQSQVSKNTVRRKPGDDHLTDLKEKLNRLFVPKDDVLTLLGELDPTEKTTVVTTPFYKDKMASAFNVGQMVKAVTILNLPLDKKLEWVEAAPTFKSQISYSDIKGFITASSQLERDTLKTDRWKSFFVDVCTNTTMVEALNDLSFDLATKLTWLDAEMTWTRLELSYSTIKPWITAAAQPERDTLKTDRWRNFFVAVCTNTTIVEALNDLSFDLATKLTWLDAEMTWTRLELSYSTIKPWITAAAQPERDTLKTDQWRNFFVAVCTNTTMVEALNDLLFDLETRLTWLDAEMTWTRLELDYPTIKPWITAAPQPERDKIKTNPWKEFFLKVCTNMTIVDAVVDLGCDLITFAWAIEKYGDNFPLTDAAEAAAACTIMNRDISDGSFTGIGEHTPKGYAEKARKQLKVAEEMKSMVGGTSTWRGSGPGSGTTFEKWASAPAEGAAPPITGATIINCWEMILLAAFRAGAINWKRIHDMYQLVPNWGQFLVNSLSFNTRIPYNPPTKIPIRGDIVFFDGSSHVALATGSLDGAGRTQVYSFWPPPNTPFSVAAPGHATVDSVKVTTIEELNAYWVGRGQPAFVLEYSTPNW